MNSTLRARYRHKGQVALIEFLRPGGFLPYPYSIEMAFQTLRCLIASGVGYYTHHRWHTSSITSLLGGCSPDHGYPTPIKALDELWKRFHVAVFAKSYAEVERWRTEKGIQAYATLDLSFLHYKPLAPVAHLGFDSEESIRKALSGLLVQSAGQVTGVSLNGIHLTARTIHQVDITISPDGFYFNLRFGFHPPGEMDSEWRYCLAKTEKLDGSHSKLDEPFLDTLRRALDRYAFIMDPANGNLTTDLHDNFIPKQPADDFAPV